MIDFISNAIFGFMMTFVAFMTVLFDEKRWLKSNYIVLGIMFTISTILLIFGLTIG